MLQSTHGWAWHTAGWGSYVLQPLLECEIHPRGMDSNGSVSHGSWILRLRKRGQQRESERCKPPIDPWIQSIHRCHSHPSAAARLPIQCLQLCQKRIQLKHCHGGKCHRWLDLCFLMKFLKCSAGPLCLKPIFTQKDNS